MPLVENPSLDDRIEEALCRDPNNPINLLLASLRERLPEPSEAGYSRIRNQAVTTSYVNLPTLSAKNVSVFNGTGADINIRRADEVGGANINVIPSGNSASYRVLENSNELQISAGSNANGVQLIID